VDRSGERAAAITYADFGNEVLAVRMIRRRPLSGTGLIEALVVRSPAPAIRFPRTRGPCPTYISRPRMLGATLARPRQETVAVESFSLLALRRTAKLSLTTRTRIGWSLPRPRDLTGVRRVNAKPAPRSDSPLVDYLSRFAQGETGASVGRRPLVGLGDFKGHVFGRNMVEHTPGRRAGGDRRSSTGKSPGRSRPRPAGNQGDMAAPADGVCPG
jgi:hypothetical protein